MLKEILVTAAAVAIGIILGGLIQKKLGSDWEGSWEGSELD